MFFEWEESLEAVCPNIPHHKGDETEHSVSFKTEQKTEYNEIYISLCLCLILTNIETNKGFCWF